MEAKKIISEYIKWLQQGMRIKEINGYEIISTPFAYSNFDLIDIIVEKKENSIILSDDGETLMNLEFSGVNIEKRKKVLKNFLNLYGLELIENKEIIKRTTENRIGRDMNDMIQGLLSIDDMFLTSNKNVKYFFREDVMNFFDEKEVFPIVDIKIAGKSNMEHNFDFVFSKKKKEEKEKLVKVINSTNRDKFLASVYSFNDVSERETDNIIIFNNTDKVLNEEIEKLLEQEEIKLLKWNERNYWIDKIIA